MREYYEKLNKTELPMHKHKSIFNNEFLVSKPLKSFASKFYANKISEAADVLSESVLYQTADSVTRNRVFLPSVKDDVFWEYLRLLYTKSDIPESLLDSVSRGNQPKITLFKNLVNNIVSSSFRTTANENYYDVVLSPELSTLINSFKENANYSIPLSAKQSVSIFEYAAYMATVSGRKKSPFVLPEFRSNTNVNKSECSILLEEQAQYNELLRRIIEQERD
ncbi:occlusion derived virus envelope glycoprotein 41 [Neodiprion abietis nucleopolyhedrovirus]|uniref:Occlusion derived virus envelope glycoprotein 41 n=1 Tax=Neodiprion abietis nucleopolyhedrovirus TaxID=204507 RepID=Q0ZP33_9CBAC|nr:occlusion derived virus envelope glycoprotein 41 [Neodiprion abietis nucleopolyhedrovirus]ABC74921.1 occlusion derived virus envelope glycoprotein 41 [Neodiprion abietis nucleopolyhedrovirus]